jgi:hypothetical protein
LNPAEKPIGRGWRGDGDISKKTDKKKPKRKVGEAFTAHTSSARTTKTAEEKRDTPQRQASYGG